MQRLVLTATLAIATLGTTAFAQQQQSIPAPQNEAGFHHHHRMHDPHKQAVMMSRRLNLSNDQTARLEPILVARKQKMDALRADTSMTPDARRAQFRTIRQETHQQLAGVLTPDQLNELKAMHHMHSRRRGQPMQPADAPPAA